MSLTHHGTGSSNNSGGFCWIHYMGGLELRSKITAELPTCQEVYSDGALSSYSWSCPSVRKPIKIYGGPDRICAKNEGKDGGDLDCSPTAHPDTVKEILKIAEPKPTSFGQTYSTLIDFIGHGLLVSEGKKWERNRKLLTPAFHFDVLRPYVRIYNQAIDVFLNKIEKLAAATNGSINVTESLNLLSLDVILRCSLSYDGQVQNNADSPYVKAIKEIGPLFMKRTVAPWKSIWLIYILTEEGRRFRRCCKYIHEFATEIIVNRRKMLADDPSLLNKRKLDFLDIVITAKDGNGDGMTDKEILDEVNTFMLAGSDTTSAALNWEVYCLAKYPEEQDKVYAEVCSVIGDKEYLGWEDISKMHAMSRFIKECLRLHTPVAGGHRVLSKPMTFEGVTLPAGSIISIGSMIMHLRPDLYPDPMKFNPERFLEDNSGDRDPYGFIPFLAGPRNCIGQVFTLNEQKVVLSRLLKRFRIHLDPDHEVVKQLGLTISAKNGIKVRLEPR